MKLKQCIPIITSLLLLIILSKCNIEEEPGLIDPSNANALSEVLIITDENQRKLGNLTTPSQIPEAPQLSYNGLNLISSNGSTIPLALNYDNVQDNVGGCILQVVGADSYFIIPYNKVNNSSGIISVPVGIPTNVDQGIFSLAIQIFDLSGIYSNTQEVEIEVLRLGTGALQISLSWDTNTDQDLRVIDPSGVEIYFGNKNSETGGQLDRDDTDGFGPENIYWHSNAPNGEYLVKVDDFEFSSSPNTIYVTISTADRSKSFTATTQNGKEIEITTIIKNGNKFEF